MISDYSLKTIEIKDVGNLKKQAIADGLLFGKQIKRVVAVYYNDEVVAFGGFILKKSKAILKNVYVTPEHREKGLATEILKARLGILKIFGYKYAEANCTPMSVKLHLNQGAKIDKVFKNGITKVVYENI